MRADLTADGLQSGWAAFISAATPLMCGQDIDVPVNFNFICFRISLFLVSKTVFEN